MSVVGLTPLPTLVLVTAAAIAFTGCNANVQLGGDTTRRIDRETISSEGVDRISVATDNGRVDLVAGPGDTDEIEIEVVMEESRDGDADWSVEATDGVVDLDGECDPGFLRHCSVGFVVTLPADVDVSTDNGAIVLDGMAGSIDAHTDNGAITGDELAAGEVSARTDNGRIRLVFDAAPSDVDVRTDNGAIDVLVPDDATRYDVDTDTDNGSVDIGVATDAGSAHRVTAASDNGSIDVDIRR